MIVTRKIDLDTKGECHIIDITPHVEREIAEAGMTSGTVTVFITGSTSAVTTIEYEPGLLADFPRMWDGIAPQDIPYDHNERWGDGNGHSHIRASLLGASLVIPFTEKNLDLGTWQQIVVVDFDNRPRTRQVLLKIMGE